MVCILFVLLISCSLGGMEEVPLEVARPLEEVVHDVPVEVDLGDQLLRSRAGTISSDLEEQIDNLIGIFDDVTRIEDEDYIRMIMQILVKNKQETYATVSPYLSRRLRDSYQQIRELTELRKRSNLKKLMKNLMAESIEEAFIRQKNELEALDKSASQSIKKHRYVLAGTIVGGVATTLAAFFAAYFSNCG